MSLFEWIVYTITGGTFAYMIYDNFFSSSGEEVIEENKADEKVVFEVQAEVKWDRRAEWPKPMPQAKIEPTVPFVEHQGSYRESAKKEV